ncbi:Ig-like domain-containing protein [Aeromicrobium sp. P5_D10]
MGDLRFSSWAACCVLVAVAGCSVIASSEPDEPAASAVPIALTPNVQPGEKDVKVSTRVKVLVEDGSVTEATLQTADGKTQIPGRINANGWTARDRLEPGTSYRLTARGAGEDGKSATVKRTFTTQQLTLEQQTYPSVAPLEGETVGVGMPVIVTFDLPVKNRALYEKHMAVTTDKNVVGSWTWLNDREAHFRPETYWPAHAKVNVRLRLNGLSAGGGIYGQQDQDIDFRVGKKVVSVVNVARHKLRYTVDDRPVRTMPVTTGDNTHRSREGIKVIMEKFSSVDMDAATTGVDSEDPGYYNISDVRWAMRLTNSGEFVHAAPWSVRSQGVANVSHGCTGMSTSDAKWLYDRSRRGDIIRYVNSPRPLEDRNGWTDWNVPWSEWTAGSALSTQS